MKFTDLADLASARVGGKAIACNDQFFAPMANLLKPGRGVFIADKFTSKGKWMDGWETRRRRTPGFDWCVVKLGMRGVIRGLDVDTNHFTGNYPEHCSVEAADLTPVGVRSGRDKEILSRPDRPEKNTVWTEILPKSALKSGSQNLFEIVDVRPWTHVRLNIFPDGGVARLRVHGEVIPDWSKLGKSVDLAAIENGGLTLISSDMYFGHKENLIMPGRAKNMGDGWETKRRRGPGHDWIIIRLGAPGPVEKIEVDTNHFKGNYPDTCSIQGCRAAGASPEALAADAFPWVELLPLTKLSAHKRHFFTKEIASDQVFTHVRLNIFPDGGVSRLRLYGKPEEDQRA